jgi:hypothetical protein
LPINKLRISDLGVDLKSSKGDGGEDIKGFSKAIERV